jgi:hypothetical protein
MPFSEVYRRQAALLDRILIRELDGDAGRAAHNGPDGEATSSPEL